ncbi:MAG: carbon storage regulator [Blastopirellula sp.]|nr:MAG: carbon storage regulator [Blastopirellula sp.]
MLVLSRKECERIRLGDDIIITVVKVAGDKVRLGIEAPPHILVLRDELARHDEGPRHDEAGVNKEAIESKLDSAACSTEAMKMAG